MGGRGCAGWSGVKRGKWDNCNSIINKIYLKKKKKEIKTMNIKMTTNSKLSTTQSKKRGKNLSKQPKQEQNHGYGDHLEGYQLGGGRWRIREKVQGIRSINGKNKIDRGMLRTV